MKYLEQTNSVTYISKPMTMFYDAVQELLSIKRSHDVLLVFNGVSVRIYPKSCEEDVADKYYMLCRIRKLS